MANSILTPSVIAREGLMRLRNNLVVANLVHRDHQAEFTGAKVGDTITIRKPASFTVQEFSSSIVIQDIIESGVTLQLEKHFDISVAVTSREWTLELDDFSERVIAPAMEELADAVDSYVLGKYTQVHNFVGTAGTPPASLSDLAQIDRQLNEQKVPMANRRAIVNPKAKADMMSIDVVAHADKRADGGEALRLASMGTIMGLDWFHDQNIHAHTAGTWQGVSFLVNGAVSADATTMNLDGGSASETALVGDLFTVAGDSGQYVVTANATASTGAITGLAFSPAAPSGGFADNSAVTIVASHDANLAMHRNAIALAVVPLELPTGNDNAAYDNFEGLGIRVVRDYNISTKTDTLSFDILCGSRTIQPELAARILG